MELLDVAGALSVLTAAGRQWNFRPFKVVTAALRPGLVTTRDQIRIEAEGSLGEGPTAEVLVVPGGYGARRASEDEAFLRALEKAVTPETRVLAFGLGLLPVARAGLLTEQDVAATPDVGQLLHALDPSVRVDPNARWLESGRIISASSSLAATEATVGLVTSVLGERQGAVVATAVGLEPRTSRIPVDIKLPL